MEQRAAPARPSWVRLFLPFACGYFLSYLFRTANAVVAEDLAAELGADAAALGLLTGAYMIGFAAMQLPLGLLLDRYGPRRVQSALLLVAAAGALWFALGSGIGALATARALIGAGVAGSLMAAFKNNVLWWPKERLAMVNSLMLVAGTLGAFAATTPMAALSGAFGWRAAFASLAAATVVVAVFIHLAVPERATQGTPERFRAQLEGLVTVFQDRFFWRLAPVSVAVQAVHAAYLSLWAGPWLRDVSGLDRAGVAAHLQVIPLAMIAGYLATGALAARLAMLGLSPVALVAVALALFLGNGALLLVPGIDAPALQWAAFGFLATAAVLPYSILSQAFPTALAGRVNTALNLLTFLAAFAAQWLIGIGVDAWGHRPALGLSLALCLAAYLWLLRPAAPAATPRRAAG
jgi:predicted MFS family arabinose efflux permease